MSTSDLKEIISWIIPLISVTITSFTTFIVLTRGNRLNLQRDQEGEWRKLKLDRYQEYIAAMSDLGTGTLESRFRYMNAINGLIFVAPPSVIEAGYAFQDQVAKATQEAIYVTPDKEISSVIREIRRDIGPGLADESSIKFRLFDIPRVNGV